MTTLTRIGSPAGAVWSADATTRMNRMYRYQRHVYDATRRYYLLGRDQLIAELQPEPGHAVLEIGCGTGRNLIAAARCYPHASFYGIDVSTEMLTTAIGAIDRAGLGGSVRVAHGDATLFKAQTAFGRPVAFDRVMISYSLSMIPDWSAVIDRAIGCLKPGGRLCIVDFGDQRRLPRLAHTMLRRWLALFDVVPRDDLEAALRQTAARSGAGLRFDRPFCGYAQLAVLSLPPPTA